MDKNFSLELWRKLIHLSSLWVVIAYCYTNTTIMLIILTILSVLSILLDAFKNNIFFIKSAFSFFTPILRKHELNSFTGSTFFLIGCLITIFLFDKMSAIFSILVLIISDTSAALIGKKFGKHRILDKTLEGTIVFLISSFIIAFIWGNVINSIPNFIYISIPSIILTSLIELISKKVRIDDNLLIPIASSSFLYLTQSIVV